MLAFFDTANKEVGAATYVECKPNGNPVGGYGYGAIRMDENFEYKKGDIVIIDLKEMKVVRKIGHRD